MIKTLTLGIIAMLFASACQTSAPRAKTNLNSSVDRSSWVPDDYLDDRSNALTAMAPEDHAIIEASINRLRALAAMRPGALTTDTHVVNPQADFDHQFEIRTTRGIPDQVRVIDPTSMVFRHYTRPEVVELISNSGQLLVGKTPYIVMHNGVARELFTDLTGVFLTIPGVKPGNVGVGSDLAQSYVDLTLHPSIPVIEIERNSIYLIPLGSENIGAVIPIIPSNSSR